MRLKLSTLIAEDRLYDLLLLVAAAAAVLSFLIFAVIRVGVLAAASAGDDIWYAESAYWLLQEGVLRRDMHANALGDAVRDFLPPIAGLFTAASFSLFGMTQFAAGLPPTFAATVGAVGIGAGVRKNLGASWITALGIGLAGFSSPELLKVAGHNRFEAFVFMFIGIGIWLGSLRPASRGGWFAAMAAAGLAAGAAAAAHYPMAPFSVALVALWTAGAQRSASFVAPFALGLLLAGLGGLAWIGLDLRFFLDQMLNSQSRYVHSTDNMPPGTFIFLAAALAFLLLLWRHPRSRWLALLAAVSMVSSIWWRSGLFYGVIALSLSLATFWFEAAPAPERRSLPTVASRLGLLALLSLTALSGVAAAAISMLQRQERNYGAFQANLLRVVPATQGGIVLIDRPAHLALRPCYAAGQLHHMPVSSAVTLPSRVLSEPAALSRVEAVIYTPSQEQELRNYIPMFRAALATPGRTVAVSPFGIGPGVDHRGPYSVIVHLPGEHSGPSLAEQCRR